MHAHDETTHNSQLRLIYENTINTPQLIILSNTRRQNQHISIVGVKVLSTNQVYISVLQSSLTMPIAKVVRDLPTPPRFPSWSASEADFIITYLREKHGAKKWQIDYIVGLLSESYLVELPKLQGDIRDSCDRSPEHLQWMLYSWAAKILGWKARRPEGHPDGFSAEFYRIVRDVIYPKPKVERDDLHTVIAASRVHKHSLSSSLRSLRSTGHAPCCNTTHPPSTLVPEVRTVPPTPALPNLMSSSSIPSTNKRVLDLAIDGHITSSSSNNVHSNVKRVLPSWAFKHQKEIVQRVSGQRGAAEKRVLSRVQVRSQQLQAVSFNGSVPNSSPSISIAKLNDGCIAKLKDSASHLLEFGSCEADISCPLSGQVGRTGHTTPHNKSGPQSNQTTGQAAAVITNKLPESRDAVTVIGGGSGRSGYLQYCNCSDVINEDDRQIAATTIGSSSDAPPL